MRQPAIQSDVADRPQLAAVALSKYFGGVRAVEDVSIELRRGEIVSIIGPNGPAKRLSSI
jgi:branched-chain amino acid transport system ATP-binding protein